MPDETEISEDPGAYDSLIFESLDKIEEHLAVCFQILGTADGG